MKIYTITLNPAFDIHAGIDTLNLHLENLANITSREAGGKGVNISRALKSFGVKNTAVIALGLENADEFKKELDGMTCLFLEKKGRIRENLTIHENSGKETRISFSGFSLDETVLYEVEKLIDADEDTVITFTGRVPSGISTEAVSEFLNKLKGKGAKIVLDSKSFSLADTLELSPWMIKPNGEEIEELLGAKITSTSEAAKKAAIFAEAGIENVMVSLGEMGALLLSGGKTYTAVPPKIDAVSTVGAGDSMVAGFISAYISGKDKAECLKTAVAFGTAACLSSGSNPPEPDKIKEIYRKI